MIRDYENPLVSLNKAGYIRAGYFLWGGSFGGGTLDSHELLDIDIQVFLQIYRPQTNNIQAHRTWKLTPRRGDPF